MKVATPAERQDAELRKIAALRRGQHPRLDRMIDFVQAILDAPGYSVSEFETLTEWWRLARERVLGSERAAIHECAAIHAARMLQGCIEEGA